MLKSPWLIGIGLTVLATVAPQPIFFRLETQRRATFSHTGVLPAGTHIDLDVQDLPQHHTLLINRCAQPCDASKLAFSLPGEGARQTFDSFTVNEPGRYYF